MSAPQTGSLNADLIVYERSQTPLVVPKPLIERILAQVNEGIQSSQPAGAEVGGLLVATRNRGAAIRVERTVAIPIAQGFDVSFQLSPDDRSVLIQAVASIAKDPEQTVVGFYRSWTCGDIRLRDTDREVFETIERAHRSYEADFRFFVVLAPVSKYVLSAEVGVRKGSEWGEWQTRTLRVQAPQGLAAGTPAPPVEESKDIAYQPTEPFDVPEPGAETALPSGPGDAGPFGLSRGRIATWLWFAAALILPATAIEVYSRTVLHRHSAPRIPVSPASTGATRLGFMASGDGNVWRLSWNRDAVTALHPEGAILSINDGDSQQQVTLTPADLAKGTVVYSPHDKNLLFQFSVLTAGPTAVEEQVRVVASAAPAGNSSAPSVWVTWSDGQKKTPRPSELVPEQQPNSTKGAPAADLPAPPAQAGSAPALTPAPASPNSSAAPVEAPRTPVAEPTRIPSIVQVRVQIDENGKVVKATLVPPAPDDPALIEPALRAARLWVFPPAQRNGRPVPSETVLNFRFGAR